MLNEIEASQLSDIEFKAMVIRKLNAHTENYQKLTGLVVLYDCFFNSMIVRVPKTTQKLQGTY